LQGDRICALQAPAALTPWLADLLDDLAGRPSGGSPVTFGDLAAGGVNLDLGRRGCSDTTRKTRAPTSASSSASPRSMARPT
jgi:hypothetical protein